MTETSRQRSWRDSLAIYLKAPVITMLFLGFSAGLPFLLVFSTLTTWLRSSGVEVAAIGFFSWIGLIYSVKVIWAPVVDGVAIPLLTRWLGQRRSWMLSGQALMMIGLLGMSSIAAGSEVNQLWLVAGFALLVAFGSATQDIAIDAFRIESASEDLQAAMASTYIIGYRGGLIIAGAGALHLAQDWSWHLSYLTMAILVGIGMLTVLLRPEPIRRARSATFRSDAQLRQYLRTHRHRGRTAKRLGAWLVLFRSPFVDLWQRYGRFGFYLLAFIALYRISDLAMASMAYPLYIDLGFELKTIADVTKVFGVIMSLLGGLLGGLLVARYGIGRILVLGAIMTAATNLVFAVLANSGDNISMLVATITGDNLSNGLSSAVFIAFLSSLTSRGYTATQYAIFSSLMTLPGKFLSGFGGIVVTDYGYTTFFVIASLMGIPAILMAIQVWRRHLTPSLNADNAEQPNT
ncbi:AmpG family muropeptide MFS transporter [Halomonas cupida]|uniref:MFS transporter n=1 Tax=Halomonas cupida TaxID=44933 RepID=A0A1M7A9D8_9GAMM|nr:MFS transporter [Halomonas cupida]GEN22485.1 MFS transporter [Halomonas cupida]SHL39199.1 MFS transporter, PAT family, beta-lactamase induction signal transducer AmpG [Halomonas cupida]